MELFLKNPHSLPDLPNGTNLMEIDSNHIKLLLEVHVN
jgi:hypothetical protein